MAADTTGATGVFRIAITGIAQTVPVPEGLKGKWLDLRHTNSGELQYGFTLLAAGSVTMDEAAALGTGDVNAGWPIPVGGRESGRVPGFPNDGVPLHLNFRCAIAGGFFAGFCSERPAA